MQRYRDWDKDSGVQTYDIESDSIKIQFKDHSVYEYTYRSAGAHHVETMKRLAQAGDGLNSYINKYVRDKYSRKVR